MTEATFGPDWGNEKSMAGSRMRCVFVRPNRDFCSSDVAIRVLFFRERYWQKNLRVGDDAKAAGLVGEERWNCETICSPQRFLIRNEISWDCRCSCGVVGAG